jgi:hypothetical protein
MQEKLNSHREEENRAEGRDRNLGVLEEHAVEGNSCSVLLQGKSPSQNEHSFTVKIKIIYLPFFFLSGCTLFF